MEVKSLIKFLFFAFILSLANSFCWVDGSCKGPYPPQRHSMGFNSNLKGKNLTHQIRNVLKQSWPQLRHQIHSGSWDNIILAVELFVNQVNADMPPLKFSKDQALQKFCKMHKINLSNFPTLTQFDVNVDIATGYESDLPLSDFLEESVQRFLYLFETYHQEPNGIMDFIECGERHFELMELVADHTNSNRYINYEEIENKTQDVQDECGVYSTKFTVEPWLVLQRKKNFYNPKFECVKCWGNIFDVLGALLRFDQCSVKGTCAQYQDIPIQNMAKDIADMYDVCI